MTGNVTSTGGAISPAGAGTIGTIGITGNLSLNSSSVLTYDLGGSSSDLITVSGSGAGNLLLGGTLNLSQASSLGMGGTYTLMTYTGSLTGSLAIGTGLSAYTTRIVTSTPGQVNLVATPICVWTQITQTNGESGIPSYSWNTAANWSVAGSTGVAFPNGVDAVATIPLFAPGYDGGNCETINLNQAITVGTLTVANGSAYGDSHGMRYFISAGTGGSLTFQVSSGTALLQENINDVYGTGAGVIYAPMTFASNTVVNTSSVNPDGFSLYNGGAQEAGLIFDAGATLSGSGSLIKTGPNGLWINSNGNASFSGGVSVQQGYLFINSEGSLGIGTSAISLALPARSATWPATSVRRP